MLVRLALTSAGKRCSREFVDQERDDIGLARLRLYCGYR